MTTIDNALYPHIIDAIVAYTPTADLPMWRGVSRELRTRVGRLLCTHLVLSSGDNKDEVAVRAARPEWWDYSPPTTRIPGLRALSPLSWSQLPRHPALDFTTHTKVLDIDGFIPAHLNLPLLAHAHAFPALEMLRMRTCLQGGYTPYLPGGHASKRPSAPSTFSWQMIR